MELAGLWRYPVKSLRGEALESADLTTDGVAGDRTVHVAGARGPLSGRTRYGLLTIPATTGPGGVPHVAGHPWDSVAAAAIVREHAGADAQLVAYDGPERFDVGNLLVATDGAVERFGHDLRRLRPNLLIGGVEVDAEPAWAGKALAVGDALVGIHSVRDRCVVTTIDPDSGTQDLDVLRRIRDEFDGQLAVNAWVIRPGPVRVGDPVELVESDAEAAHLGGWIAGAPYELHAAPAGP
ncbi:MAG: MOSC domain-containing protein [Egibacteraceae bacterium]